MVWGLAGSIWFGVKQGVYGLGFSREYMVWGLAGSIWFGVKQGVYGLGLSREYMVWGLAGSIWFASILVKLPNLLQNLLTLDLC